MKVSDDDFVCEAQSVSIPGTEALVIAHRPTDTLVLEIEMLTGVKNDRLTHVIADARLTLDQAKALRDFLNEVLPTTH